MSVDTHVADIPTTPNSEHESSPELQEYSSKVLNMVDEILITNTANDSILR